MKIHEAVRDAIVLRLERRIESLESISAPEVVIEHDRRRLANARTAEIRELIGFKGDDAILESEVTGVEAKTGRGGKPYLVVHFDAGRLFYFPEARFGPFSKTEAK